MQCKIENHLDSARNTDLLKRVEEIILHRMLAKNSSLAISLFDSPLAAPCTTSNSRLVSDFESSALEELGAGKLLNVSRKMSDTSFPAHINPLRTCLDRKSTRLNSSHLGISY